MTIRELERDEISEIWSIDRTEAIEHVYHLKAGELVLDSEHHDVLGWPAGEPEKYDPILLDCMDHGGSAYGAFADATLVGAAVLEGRRIGQKQDRLQLKFLHVSQSHRGAGVGRALFAKTVKRASELGARFLYISATPSENTVRFYLGVGCRVARDVDGPLYALEPEDIHLDFEI